MLSSEEMEQAACGKLAKEVFFDDIDDHARNTERYIEAVAEARGHCDGCPIRQQCFVGQVKVPFGFAGGYTAYARRFLRLGDLRWSERR